MPDTIDPRELAAQLQREGGFSVSAAGRPPRSGVMVSDVGAEHVVEGPASARDISTYVQRHARSLERQGTYVGAWVDEGRTYLDVSRRFPSQGQADIAIKANAQIAGFDVEAGSEVDPRPGGLPLAFTPNEEPYHRKHRRRDQIVGDGRRRAAMSKARVGHSAAVQPMLPGMEG
jgi:hypothetical protein